MSQRIVYFDMMRGLIVLLVVVYHACCWGYSVPGDIPPVYDRVNTILANIRMPLLMIISGYLIHSIGQKSRGQVSDRVAQLLWIYAMWMPINLLAHLAYGNSWTGIEGIGQKIQLEWINPTTEMWFIWCLAIYTILAYSMRNVPVAMVLALMIVANAVTYQIGWFSDQIAGTLIPRMSLFFFGGIILHGQIRNFVTAKFSIKLLLLIVIATAGVHIGEDLVRERYGIHLFQGAESVMVSLLVMYCCKVLAEVAWFAEVISKVGQNTLPIYLVHVPLILMFRSSINESSGREIYLVPFLLVMISIGGGLLLHRAADATGAGWLYRRPAWFDARRVHPFILRVRSVVAGRGVLAGR